MIPPLRTVSSSTGITNIDDMIRIFHKKYMRNFKIYVNSWKIFERLETVRAWYYDRNEKFLSRNIFLLKLSSPSIPILRYIASTGFCNDVPRKDMSLSWNDGRCFPLSIRISKCSAIIWISVKSRLHGNLRNDITHFAVMIVSVFRDDVLKSKLKIRLRSPHWNLSLNVFYLSKKKDSYDIWNMIMHFL